MDEIFADIEQQLGSEAKRFLEAVSPDSAQGKLGSTAKVYRRGLTLFAEYLGAQTVFPEIKNISQFLKAVRVDSHLEDSLSQRFPDRILLKGYIAFLGEKTKPCLKTSQTSEPQKPNPLYAPKSTRNYIVPIQSLGTYFKIPISTTYSDLPPAVVVNEKYPWSIEQVGDFIKRMDNPMYQTIATWFVQSGLSNYDVLHLPYSKLKEQLKEGTRPLCISLYRHKTLKFEIKFRTFLGSLSLDFFNKYLSSRKSSFNDEDRIFKISSVALEGFFKRQALSFLGDRYDTTFRNAMCPASLRSAFRTFMADANCPNHYVEYMMGHKLSGDLSKTYTCKSDDSWRQTYSRYEPAVTFTI